MTGVSKFQEYSQDSFLGKMFELNHIKTISSTVMLSEVIKDVGGFDESLIYSYEYDLFLRIGSKSRNGRYRSAAHQESHYARKNRYRLERL